MAKKLVKQIKVQAPGGKATPAPPLGPVLGQAGINIGEFVNQFNEQTRDQMGEIVPAVISVFDDRSFSFVLKTSPASRLILKAIGKDKGSGKNLTAKAGTITRAQVREVAEEDGRSKRCFNRSCNEDYRGYLSLYGGNRSGLRQNF